MPVRALMPQTVSLLSLDRMTFDRHSSLSLPLRVTRMHARELFVRPRARLCAVLPCCAAHVARQGSSALPGSCASHHLERGAIFIVVQVLRRK